MDKLIDISAKLQVDIRLGDVYDLPFIKDSWTKSIKYQYPNQYALDFTQHYQSHLSTLITNSVILVANLQFEPDDIIAYLVYTSFRGNQVIHFAYTKTDARQQGIFNQLVEFSNPQHLPIVFTHAPKHENVMIHFTKKFIYDPSLLQVMS